GNSDHPVLMYRNAFKSLVDDSFVYTLEHLYPAKAKDDEIVPDMEELKNKLPNLALLYDQDNSRFKNDKFSLKKAEYLHSRLNTTIQLEKLEDFTKDEFLARREDLIVQFKKIFTFGIGVE
ncbi:HNH endonuclease, partial [Vibrio alginolyticus]|nr:HNH endonuclease [Vibrio alginolyticus]